ncbi:hypothetical protein BH24DEI2_BH24DEI2_08460 [soil metagenome]
MNHKKVAGEAFKQLGQTQLGQAVEMASASELPTDKRIPNDYLLRGQSPQEIVGAVTGWLRSHYSPPRPVAQPIIAETPTQVRRALKSLGYRTDLLGLPRALSREGKMVFFPQVVLELRSSVFERALAARTLSHEYFHAARIAPSKWTPVFVEEGMADFFADLAVAQMLGGADLQGYGYYRERAEGAKALMAFLADDDEKVTETLLFQTRAEPDVLTFLTNWLRLKEVNDPDINAILFYTSVEAWRAVIRRVTGR